MAVKKTELYSSLWASCDALRGGMDSSQYKDYILTLLFMKYVTDKFKGQKYGDLTVFDKAHDPNPDPEKRTGCSFDDFIALKNNKNIGEGMDKIIARLAEVNDSLKGVIDIAHFNDEQKIGVGQEMVDKLTKLIAIFQRPELDFSHNKAEGDDIIGDAYEYLMRNFASESGKSKGQFYTPAEVSRILAKVIGIDHCKNHDASICDPACGSGSLLIRAMAEAPFDIDGCGQEKDSSTAGLAKMNAVLHNKSWITIRSGNTFSNPRFLKEEDASELRTFDYIVANPPFSMKNWTDGCQEFGRFDGYGDRPPEKNGDYAWLMHILKTLKSDGKAAVILPHGVLFRGNAEETIRTKIIDKGWIKGIVSLPANLFYGTGIPACILIIDKEGAANRQGIFMIDASHGYVKDGNKNRLREQDIYRIVTTFNEQLQDDPKYARLVPYSEIKNKRNNYNLNITRYIDSSDGEDAQNIDAHIHGGIPAADIDSLEKFWEVFDSLRESLFEEMRPGFYKLIADKDEIRNVVYSNEAFAAYGELVDEAFIKWKEYAYPQLISIDEDLEIKEMIVDLADELIKLYEPLALLDKYDVYQVLLAYWNEVMNDDVIMIATDEKGYALARETENIMGEYTSGKKKGEEKVVGWEGKLIPKTIIADSFFAAEKAAIEEMEDLAAQTEAKITEMIEEADEESVLTELAEDGKIKAKDVEAKIAEILGSVTSPEIKAIEEMYSVWSDISKKADYTAYITKHPLCKSVLNEKGSTSKTALLAKIKELRAAAPIPASYAEDYEQLTAVNELMTRVDEYTKTVKALYKELDDKCKAQYDKLTDDEIIDLLVNKKWFNTISNGINELYAAISHTLANRIVVLVERYETTLPELSKDVNDYEAKVKAHLERMGFKW
jgi:type I restriction enzyme M protein